jgi:hypothetical protein
MAGVQHSRLDSLRFRAIQQVSISAPGQRLTARSELDRTESWLLSCTIWCGTDKGARGAAKTHRFGAQGPVTRTHRGRDVELIALPTILVLSIGAGLAGSRLLLSGLFVLMTRQIPDHSADISNFERARS